MSEAPVRKSSRVAVVRMGMGFAFVNLLLAAVAGALLRLAFVIEIDWFDFKDLLHAHSHVAMLGWASMALFALISTRLLPAGCRWRTYLWLFILMEIMVIVMGVSFTLQGYGLWSIASSSAFVVLVYIFTLIFLHDLNHSAAARGPATRMVRTALFFLLLSTVVLWAIGPVIAMDLRFSRLFHLLIQAFLHFMINGWFIFAILGLIFDFMRTWRITVNPRQFRSFYILLIVSTFLTYALAIAWSDPEWWVFGINSLGVILQGIALIFFLQILVPVWRRLRMHMSRLAFLLLGIAIVAFALKIVIQTCVVLPVLATVAYTIRYFVIGFLHLILLGVVTMAVLAILLDTGQLSPRLRITRWGVVMLCTGFFASELLLFTQGVMAWGALGFIPAYYLVLFLVSCLLPAGVLLLILSLTRRHGSS